MKLHPAVDAGNARFFIAEFNPERSVRRRGKLAVASRNNEAGLGLAPKLGNEEPALEQFGFCYSRPHVLAGFVSVFCDRKPSNFQRAVLIEKRETIRKQRQGDSRPGRRLHDGVTAGILSGPQIRKRASAIDADARRTLEEKNGCQRIATDSLPAARFS